EGCRELARVHVDGGSAGEGFERSEPRAQIVEQAREGAFGPGRERGSVSLDGERYGARLRIAQGGAVEQRLHPDIGVAPDCVDAPFRQLDGELSVGQYDGGRRGLAGGGAARGGGVPG